MPNHDPICEVAKERLLPWLAGRLDGTPEGVEFEEHVKQCPTCAELVSDRRRAMQVLLALTDERAGATAGKTERKPLQPPAWKAFWESKGVPVLAAVAVVLLGISYLMKPGEGLLGEKALSDSPPAAPSALKSDETATTHTQVSSNQEASQASSATPQEDASGGETAETPKQPAAAEPAPKKDAPKQAEAEQPAEKQKPARKASQPSPAPKPASVPKRRSSEASTQPGARSSSGSGARTEGRVEVFDPNGRLVGTATTGGKS
jgi:hypothetical protein